jgi:HEPN domain-containing protein
MTKSIDPKKASGYIIKAEGFLEMANLALQHSKYDSAVMNAVHSAISALDALTTSFKGKRASDEHTEVLSLIKGIFPSLEYEEIKKQFTSLISKKNASEYQPDLMDPKEAQDSVKWAERILAKVKIKLK